MADVNSQVALGINPPDPNQGLNTLSKILGLGQQGLAIKGQQSENITRAAQATEANQNAKEKMGLANLLKDPVANGITDQNGVELPDAKAKILAVAPTTGAQHYTDLVNASKTKVAFNSAVNDLRTSERGELASAVGGIAARAESPEEITNGLDTLVESKRGTPEFGNYQTIAGTMKQVVNHLADQGKGNAPADPEMWRKAALNIASSMLPPSSTVGPGGLALPSPATNAAGQNQDRSLVTGARTPPTLLGGATNPSSPQVAGATTRQTATGNADVDRANIVSASVAPANQTITVTQEIDDLADQVYSGKFASAISKAAAAAGISSGTYARQLLEKDLGRLKATASAGAGSDQRQANILSGFPEATSNPQTIHTAMDFVRGVARQDLARGALLNKVKTKDENLRGFQHLDDMLTGNTDPLMHEFMALKPTERAGFYKRNFSTPEAAQAFKNKISALQDHSGLMQ